MAWEYEKAEIRRITQALEAAHRDIRDLEAELVALVGDLTDNLDIAADIEVEREELKEKLAAREAELGKLYQGGKQ